MDASTPQARLGRYELMVPLAQGGMGAVHLARLTGAAGFEKLCIVKTILPQMQADPQFVERFHHEARVLVQLNHSHIAQVYDMGDYEGSLYMAIEYVPGVDLARVANRVAAAGEQVPLPIALHIIQQVAEALGYAHRKVGPDGQSLGIVHRDVSPHNIMVSYEGEAKVIDFGLAKSAAKSKATMPSTVMGKLGYMSPEQALAVPLDYRSDIFSTGIVAWELITGQPLYTGGTLAEMLAAMANPRVPSVRSLRPEVPEEIDDAILKALQREPHRRYQRADDLARRLNELAVRGRLSVGAEEVGEYIKAVCPDEFAAERKLQSQLSLLRRRSSPRHVPEAEPELPGTVVRRSKPEVAQLTAAQRALSVVEGPASPAIPGSSPGRPAPGQEPTRIRASPAPAVQAPIQEADLVSAVRTGPSPLVLAAAAIGLLGLLGAGWYLLGRGESPAPARLEVASAPAVPSPTPAATPVAEVVPADPPAAPRPTKAAPSAVVGRQTGGVPRTAEAKQPPQAKPAEAKPAEAKPAEVKPAEAKPAEVKPAEVKPAEAKPAEVKPAEVKPAAPDGRARITGLVNVSRPGSLARPVIDLRNDSPLTLTGCELRLNNGATISDLAPLGPRQLVQLDYGKFRADQRTDPNFEKGWSLLVCKEGGGYLATVYR